MEERRPLFKKGELLLILAAVLVAAVFFLIRALPGPSGVARVFIDGDQVLEISLSGAENGVVSLSGYGIPAELEILDGKIRFINVTCPDHICEKTGFVWKDGQTAVCMPNRAVLTVATP